MEAKLSLEKYFSAQKLHFCSPQLNPTAKHLAKIVYYFSIVRKFYLNQIISKNRISRKQSIRLRVIYAVLTLHKQ